MPDDPTTIRDRVAKAALRAVETALGDVLVPAAREEALAGIAAVLPALVDRATVLLRAADFAEGVAEKLRAHHEFERSNGALDVMTELRRLVGGVTNSDTEAHAYLSTGCLHGQHGYCSNVDGVAGLKKPAQCKFCAAPCICGCHAGVSGQPASADTTKQPAAGAESDRIVAYRSPLPGALSLYCTRHVDELGAYTPLTSDDLPDGGLCVSCGADLLIPQEQSRG